jgi:hypothetical protein
MGCQRLPHEVERDSEPLAEANGAAHDEGTHEPVERPAMTLDERSSALYSAL